MTKLTTDEIQGEANSLLQNVLDVSFLTDKASDDLYGRDYAEDYEEDDIDSILDIVYAEIRKALT